MSVSGSDGDGVVTLVLVVALKLIYRCSFVEALWVALREQQSRWISKPTSCHIEYPRGSGATMLKGRCVPHLKDTLGGVEVHATASLSVSGREAEMVIRLHLPFPMIHAVQ